MSEEFDLSTFEISMVIRQMKFEDITEAFKYAGIMFSRHGTMGRESSEKSFGDVSRRTT